MCLKRSQTCFNVPGSLSEGSTGSTRRQGNTTKEISPPSENCTSAHLSGNGEGRVMLAKLTSSRVLVALCQCGSMGYVCIKSGSRPKPLIQPAICQPLWQMWIWGAILSLWNQTMPTKETWAQQYSACLPCREFKVQFPVYPDKGS